MGNRKKPIDKLVAQTRLPEYIMKVVEDRSIRKGISVSEYLREVITEEMVRRYGKEIEKNREELISAFISKREG